ncbi:MAG: signal peptidase II [Alphaproteobacteria bacterium]|nr:signal peptidase II [Alphaproteobacteria bacterium]
MKKFLKYIAIIVAVFLLDFVSKAGLLSFLAAKYGSMVFDPNTICAKCNIEGIFIPWQYIIGSDYGLSNLFNIQFVWNSGVSFSALNGVMPVILSCLTSIIIAYLIYYLFKKSLTYERFALAMIIGGALGNLTDRIRFGAVADFIQWHIGGIWTFPAIFNIGDVFITFGVILYFINMFINRNRCLRNIKGK